MKKKELKKDVKSMKKGAEKAAKMMKSCARGK